MHIQIEVRLFATLRQGRFRRKTLQVPLDSTIAELCRVLGIIDGEAVILLVNGAATRQDHQLASGDEVALFPAIGGG
jgi:sulfur carrier protein